MAFEEELFDPAEFRAWQQDKRGERFWEALRQMGNLRMNAIRIALKAGNHIHATHLAGELEAIDEVRQLVDLIIDEYRAEQEDKAKESK